MADTLQSQEWKQDRFVDLKVDWVYLGKQRWDLMLYGVAEKFVKLRPAIESGKSAKESKVPPDFRKVRVHVTIENGLVPK